MFSNMFSALKYNVAFDRVENTGSTHVMVCHECDEKNDTALCLKGQVE